jgi:hypothetical protein
MGTSTQRRTDRFNVNGATRGARGRFALLLFAKTAAAACARNVCAHVQHGGELPPVGNCGQSSFCGLCGKIGRRFGPVRSLSGQCSSLTSCGIAGLRRPPARALRGCRSRGARLRLSRTRTTRAAGRRCPEAMSDRAGGRPSAMLWRPPVGWPVAGVGSGVCPGPSHLREEHCAGSIPAVSTTTAGCANQRIRPLCRAILGRRGAKNREQEPVCLRASRASR